jgi:hypothetical protein
MGDGMTAITTHACDACGRGEHLRPDEVICDDCRAAGRGIEGEPSWHVVTSQGYIILGVYGAALLSHAQEAARKVEATTGFPAFVNQVLGTRPRVGQRWRTG